MKKTFLLFSVLLILISFSHCKKEKRIPNYTITGKLLESVSNPIPVNGFNLTLYRKVRSGFTGWSPGIAVDFKTNSDGTFSVTHAAEKGTGLNSFPPYGGPLTIFGGDQVSYPGVVIQLYPLPPNKDTSLNIVYAR